MAEGTIEGKRRLFDQGLLQALVCANCRRFFQDKPIYLCDQGHSLCMDCYKNAFDGGRCCPICMTVLQGPRLNWYAIILFVGLHVPCKFASYGCERVTLIEDKSEHEDFCQFNYQLPCPIEAAYLGACSWRGHLSLLLPHLESAHTLQAKRFSSVARLLFVNVLEPAAYLKFQLVFLQDSGLSLLVALSNNLADYEITVRVLEFSVVPRTVTVSIEKENCDYVRLSKSTLTRSLELISFNISVRDVQLLSTEGTFIVNLAIVDQQL
jgi:hypothetical protein